ncbi:LOW QUALITY PROTEIN: DIS3-like exonuclease 2 [Ptychodera flava]|uniref:LOW QUALITY PROTEIN: DIS3-like exonuclease 2 n=1 Tax=Ptychodera flava TaxID=63121 RepID=UPI00396A0A07
MASEGNVNCKSDDEPDVIIEGEEYASPDEINTPQSGAATETQHGSEGSGKRRRRRGRGKKNKSGENMQTPSNHVGPRHEGQENHMQGQRSGQGARPRSGRMNGQGQGQRIGSPRGPRYQHNQYDGSPQGQRIGSPRSHRYQHNQYDGSPQGQRIGSPRDPRYQHNQYDGSPHTPRSQYNMQDRRGPPMGSPYQNGSPHFQNHSGQRHVNTPESGNRNSVGKQKKKQQSRNSTPRKQFKPFEDYMSKEDVQRGLKRSELIQGSVRINPKSFEDSFISDPCGYADIHIQGLHARNRALEGDIVAVQLLPKSEWKVMQQEYEDFKALESSVEANLAKLRLGSDVKSCDQKPVNTSQQDGDQQNSSCAESEVNNSECQPPAMPEPMEPVARQLFVNEVAGQPRESSSDGGSDKIKDVPEKFYQKRGKVVYIIEKKHSRAATGHLKMLTEKDATDALFAPIDHRLPRIRVPLTECPEGFVNRPGDFANVLFVGRIIEWSKDSSFALGCLHKSLGEAGEIEPETEGFLIENGVDFSEFSDKALGCLPDVSADKPGIPNSELSQRRDLRQQCIFTIDPATARDLDDALSCQLLPDGTYEVGVHIADVSYFLEEGTELDSVASARATSVYLVQKVIPMLPRLLCEQLCSLNPAEDRLTFSVIWKITEHGEILDEWMGRSVICSCVKMTYQHAQGIIENPTRVWTQEELPPVTSNHSVSDIVKCVLNLNKIAVNLRKQRFEEGALRLDQPKLSFTIEGVSGLPNGCSVYEQRDSNRLVEEFMLLANMAVAHRIYRSSPERALLRRHPPPKSKMIDDVVNMCSKLGMPINANTAGELQTSLRQHYADDEHSKGRCQILVHLCSKPMQMAKYFCTSFINDEENYRHYALNVPFYTHFTSPIRRYADVVVHRLLGEALKCGPSVLADKVSIQAQAGHCNDRKTAAKRVQDLSVELFFAIFIKECGPVEEDGMVLGVLDHSVDVLVLKFGVIKRVYCNALPLREHIFHKNHSNPALTIIWKADEDNPEETNQTLRIFSLVNVILKADEQPMKYKALLKRPESHR